MAIINIEVISDVVCALFSPHQARSRLITQWCYIGKRTLDRAISLYKKTYPGGKDDDFRIVWQPYYLRHNPGSESVDKEILREQKFRERGWTPDKVARITQRVHQIGRAVGIQFGDGSGKIGNTRDAHRLIHLSQFKPYPGEVQEALVEKLFEAYHELEQDIADHDVLREIATGAGLEAKDVDELLDSDLIADVVDGQAAANRARVNNSGVPYFIIQGEHHVDGAQDLQEFFEIFIKIKEAEGL